MAIYGWSTDSLIAANHIKVDDITTLSTSTEVSYLRQWNFDAENPEKKTPRMNLNRYRYDIYTVTDRIKEKKMVKCPGFTRATRNWEKT